MSNEKQLIANDQITASQVRLIHPETGFNQVMSVEDALLIASNEHLDLVQFSDQEVPVVKLVDLGKFVFEQKQKEKALKKAQRESTVQTKEIQLSLDIQSHDMNTKISHANKFLSQKKQVKVTLKLYGRSRSNKTTQELALAKVKEFINALDSHVVIQSTDKLTDLVMFVVANKAS